MGFNREELYGTSFVWYAVDDNGHIARIEMGYGPIPHDIFEDEDAYDEVYDYFENLEEICEGVLSDAARKDSDKGIGDYSLSIKEAETGVYSYDEKGYGPDVRLTAFPKRPLKEYELPANIRDYLRGFRIKGVLFEQAGTLTPKDHFACD